MSNKQMIDRLCLEIVFALMQISISNCINNFMEQLVYNTS